LLVAHRLWSETSLAKWIVRQNSGLRLAWRWTGIALTFHAVCLAWCFFRISRFEDSLTCVRKWFDFDPTLMLVGGAAAQLAFVMLPKVESRAQVDQALAHIDSQAEAIRLPVHVLIESPAALHQVFDIAAHPRVQSMSFGLMDFVSAHGGAIPASAMALGGPGAALDQFHHPLVLRAKMEIASACHAHGKVPSHCVVTELRDTVAIEAAARQAAQAFGFMRMWSIHPAQIRPILAAMAPDDKDIETACAVLLAAQHAEWAPISHDGQLHDRASYRFFWQLLQRAQATGRKLPVEAQSFFA
jgi:citrate lyase subunit beta/citryl-CoA lyase